ncbi:hypothetical protein KC929_02330 [Patescibacteria group bacterium]|nr:hypothetical protein [Patescibacteria group bacterium]
MKFGNKKVLAALMLLVVFLTPVSISFNSNQENQKDNISEVTSIVDKQLSVNLELNVSYALTTGKCNLSLSSLGHCFLDAILTFYEILFYATTQVFVVIVGLMMDAVLFFSISSNFYRSSGMIEAGWEILRDLTNIVFIFALLVVAFRMVLGQNDGKTKETLIKTILVALVVNFSLFVTYAIVDASNILAYTFYNRIDADASNFETGISNGVGDDADENGINIASWVKDMGIEQSVSLAIAGQINPQRIINASGVASNGGTINFFQGMILITGMAVMNILMIYVFFSVMMLFAGRIIGIMILGILAPLAFASHAIPNMMNTPYIGWKFWFKELIQISFMAPIFMFFMWLTVKFISNEGVLATLSRTIDGSWITSIINTYLLLLLIAGILLMSKKITTRLAGEVGGFALKAVQAAVGGTVAAAGLVATGGAAAAGGLARLAPRDSRLNNIGRTLQATNFNFAQTRAGQFLSRQTGINFGGQLGNLSYGRADTAVRRGANSIRSRISDISTGQTPQSVVNWQNAVQQSRDALTARRSQNVSDRATRRAQNNANAAERQYDYVNQVENLVNVNDLPGRIEELQAELQMRTTQQAQDERDNIQNTTNALNANIQTIQDDIRAMEQNRQRLINQGNTGAANAITTAIRNRRQDIRNIENNIRHVQRSTLQQRIQHLQEQLQERQQQAVSDMFNQDMDSRFTQQDSSLTRSRTRRQQRVRRQASRRNNQQGNNS